MRETQQVRRGRCRHLDTFHDFYLADAELIFCESRSFRKAPKHVVSSRICTLPHSNDQSRRKCISPPRSTLLYDSRRDTLTYGARSKFLQCDGSNVPLPTPLAFVGGVSNGSDGHVGTMKTARPAIGALPPIVLTRLS